MCRSCGEGKLPQGGSHFAGELQCGAEAVCGSCGVWELQCMGLAVSGSCGLWKVRYVDILLCMRVVVYGGCSVRKLHCGGVAIFEVPNLNSLDFRCLSFSA